MDISSNKCTPVSNVNVTPAQNYQSSGKLRLSNDKINRTLLTPCRRVGLKRKSIGHTPRVLLEGCSTLEQSKSTDFNNVSSASQKSDSRPTDCTTEPIVTTNKNPCNQEVLDNCNENTYNNKLTKKYAEVKKRRKVLTPKLCGNNKLSAKPDTINLELLESLANNIKEKKDRYKHSELSKLYEKKHDLQTLKDLTKKWKQGCQKALVELHHLIQQNGHTLSMAQLLAHSQLSCDLIGYNEECDDFE